LTTRIDQFICSQAIALSLKGMPGIYLHSLLGSTNWPEGVKQSGRNRTINREKLRFNDVVAALEDPASQRHQVYQRYRQLLATRKSEALFSPVTGQKIHDYGEKVFAVERHDGNSRDKRTLLALHNVSDTNVLIPIEGAWTDLISGQTFEDAAELQPYQIAWLKRPADDRHKK
jgi:sucrose phosphorylase